MTSRWWRMAVCLAAVAAAAWVAHYWLSHTFGVYEDDYLWPVRALDATGPAQLARAGSKLSPLPLRGQPFLLPFLEFGLARLGFALNGIWGMYVVGWLIVVLNGWLVFSLSLRLTRRWVFALAAGVALVLYPPDATQAFLTHSFGLQTSLTFLLGALNLWVRGWRVAAYVLAAGGLLTNEMVYPVMLAAPLLTTDPDRKAARELSVHLLVCAAILAVMVAVRVTTPEGGFVAIDPWAFALQAGKNMATGALAVPTLSLGRIVTGLWTAAPSHPLLLLSVVLSTPLIFNKLTAADVGNYSNGGPRQLRRVAIAGLVMIPLAYLFTFTTSAMSVHGRATRVHSAAVVGFALLAGWSVTLLWDKYGGRTGAGAFSLLLGLTLAGAVGNGLGIQEDYRLAWDIQRAAWSDITRLCPDAGENTVILLDPYGLRDAEEIRAFSPAVSSVARAIYRFPPGWERPPVAAMIRDDWRRRIERGEALADCIDWGNRLELAERYRDAVYILLEVGDGKLRRVDGNLELAGRTLHFKQPTAPVLPALPGGVLHDLVILRPGDRTIDYAE